MVYGTQINTNKNKDQRQKKTMKSKQGKQNLKPA